MVPILFKGHAFWAASEKIQDPDRHGIYSVRPLVLQLAAHGSIQVSLSGIPFTLQLGCGLSSKSFYANIGEGDEQA